MQYLYRNFAQWAIATTITVSLLGTFAVAQIRDRTHQDQPPPTDSNQSKINANKTKRGPRAIAVVEFLPGGATRLVPVALWINGRFYDASLYGANPAPMAVEPETVYEATTYGEPVGLFTVTTPEEMKGSWIATGKWKPHQALDEKLAKQPKPKPSANPDDERPTLHRAGSSASSASSAPTSTQTTSSSGSSSPAENDPNRPTLKKPSPPPPPATSPSAPPETAQTANSSSPSSDENDPSRPVLRRGKPEAQSAAPRPTSTSAAAAKPPAAVAAAQDKTAASPANLARRSYPAVSDASPHESRSLLYSMNPEERSAKTDRLRALALEEVRKFVASRHTPALPNSPTTTDSDLRAFDLEYSNSPTLVFTATVPVEGAKAFRGGEFDYYVTFVAREDINGTPIKIFSSVTDSNHLDAFARMEIIDAVDADANGRGDLLFRQYSDTGISYSLYRVFPYDMQKVFEGGSGV